jgi:hypothetical protein
VTAPQKGDIVVMSRGNSSWKGHVGFVDHVDENGDVHVLGGNQGRLGEVSIEKHPASSVLGYRRISAAQAAQYSATQPGGPRNPQYDGALPIQLRPMHESGAAQFARDPKTGDFRDMKTGKTWRADGSEIPSEK